MRSQVSSLTSLSPPFPIVQWDPHRPVLTYVKLPVQCQAHTCLFCDTIEQRYSLGFTTLPELPWDLFFPWDRRAVASAPWAGAPSLPVGRQHLSKPQLTAVSSPPLHTRHHPSVLIAFSVPSLRRAAKQKNKSKLPACLGARDASAKRSLASHYPPQ